MNNIEILAPVGKEDCLTAALRAGCDAVYLGAKSFSARAGAQNFTNEELKNVVEKCHQYGVRVHLTVNTLLHEDELCFAMQLIKYACEINVDAVLVQDLGLLYYIKKCCPELPIHASTQLSIHTVSGTKACIESGFDRVVLSREMSLKEIKAVHNKYPDFELEAFVHGALCMSVSGQCYLSAMLGSRSGNRGQCAQPCRLPFAAPSGTGHDLSLKDLSMISRQDELCNAGITSLKIEGRLKRPEYVAAAVTASRLKRDTGSIPDELIKNLETVFSRGGFTSGYPDGKLGKDMFGTRNSEDSIRAKETFPKIHDLYKNEFPHVNVTFEFNAQINSPCSLCATDEDGNTVFCEGDNAEKAIKVCLSDERCKEQLSKSGGMPFKIINIKCNIEDGISLPMKSINSLRRTVLEQLLKKRAVKKPISFNNININFDSHKFTKTRVRAHFPDCEIPDEALMCEIIYVPYDSRIEKLDDLKRRGFHIALEIPRGMFGIEDYIKNELKNKKSAGYNEVWAGTLNASQLAKDLGLIIHGGYSMNIYNTAALEWCREYGFKDCELSFELSLEQISQLKGVIPRGIMVYGRQALMLTRNCPIANGGGCQHCIEPHYITDRKNISFPVKCFGSCSEILNSVPLSLCSRLKEVNNCDFITIHFTLEDIQQRAEILKCVRFDKPVMGNITRGLAYRGVI